MAEAFLKTYDATFASSPSLTAAKHLLYNSTLWIAFGKSFEEGESLEEILHDHEEPHCKSSPGEQQKEDLIDELLELQMDETLEFHLTRDNIKAIIVDIFGAGADSTTNALAWAMAELIRNPKAMEKAQNEVRRIAGTREMLNGSDMQEVCYLKLVIHGDSTTLPYSSSTNPRETLATCTVNGYEIATETRVIINAWAIGTDPDYWGCSEEFIPERFTDSPMDYKGNDFKYIPFGAGRRGCPGALGFLLEDKNAIGYLQALDWGASESNHR
ncbi:cytochrome P450 71D8 [Amborella trichopoda]|uniref:cytochrome P450 71D8 n=1 Tax=Amborella trichopoda TaxID=13333 RepID=UPI0005D3F622|nr:cytochrome P450 71D8 [Amborella trichopoda]|eukprot:XP_011627644.1 cytochrome P450 71D8 [Amborella trichopoda]